MIYGLSVRGRILCWPSAFLGFFILLGHLVLWGYRLDSNFMDHRLFGLSWLIVNSYRTIFPLKPNTSASIKSFRNLLPFVSFQSLNLWLLQYSASYHYLFHLEILLPFNHDINRLSSWINQLIVKLNYDPIISRCTSDQNISIRNSA